jgi:ankyrin repeat protein
MIRFNLILVSLFLVLFSFGQSENIFLERSYWKENPTIEEVKSKIKKGNNPSEFNQHKFDAVTWAIIEKVTNSTVWFLLEQDGNSVNKRSHDGRTPIFWAAYRGNVELMTQLIDKGAKTDLIDDHGFSLVNFAATTGQVDIDLYNLCIQNGAQLNQEFDKDGATPLLLIIPHLESLEMIQYFEDNGLSIDQKDRHGNNAFVYAARTGNEPLMNLALERGLDPRANNDAALIFGVKGARGVINSIEVYRYLVQVGLSICAKDDQGMTSLHHLAKLSKDIAIFEYFLSNMNDLNVKDLEGNTPFLTALEYNSVEIIKFLSHKQINKKAVNGKGENAIHLAAKRNDLKVMNEALTFGLNINARTSDGLTVLHIAAMKAKDGQLLKMLITAGANKNSLTDFQESAFDLAYENEALQSAKIDLSFLK